MKSRSTIQPLAVLHNARWLMAFAVAVLVASACTSAYSAGESPETPSASIKLKEKQSPAGRDEQPNKPDGLSAVKLFGSLALVIGLFLLAVWLLRRAAPRGAKPLPTEVFESLGRAPLAFRNQAHLLRLGNKLLLVSASVGGVEPLAEITDPAEVERLTELCRLSRASVAASKGAA